MERDAFHVSYLSDKTPESVFHGQAVRTVAYLRVSTAQQDLRSQRLAILEYARKHDFRIDYFIEATASGQASEKRRRLVELMNVLQRRDRLVVSELSPLGRSLGQIVAILDRRSTRRRLPPLRNSSRPDCHPLEPQNSLALAEQRITESQKRCVEVETEALRSLRVILRTNLAMTPSFHGNSPL